MLSASKLLIEALQTRPLGIVDGVELTQLQACASTRSHEVPHLTTYYRPSTAMRNVAMPCMKNSGQLDIRTFVDEESPRCIPLCQPIRCTPQTGPRLRTSLSVVPSSPVCLPYSHSYSKHSVTGIHDSTPSSFAICQVISPPTPGIKSASVMNHQGEHWHRQEPPTAFFDYSTAQRVDRPPPLPPLPSPALTKAITTIALLLLGYYALTFLDAWPSTIKRNCYETIVYLIPSHLIYFIERIMARFGRSSDPDLFFRKTDFGNQAAKAHAIHRMLGQSGVPMALRKARSLSGLEAIIPVTKELGPPGLGNWDNSCYQNSILQGLASMPAFQKYIQRSLRLCHELDVPATTHRALTMFLAQLSDTDMNKETLWTPGVLKSMDSWQQQDAQEYFSRILEVVEKENTRCAEKLKRRSRLGFERINRESDGEQAERLLKRVSLDDSNWAPGHRRSNSEQDQDLIRRVAVPNYSRPPPTAPLKNPVDGMLAQALECNACGFSEGFTLTQFNCLTLNLGLRGQCQLEELIEDYIQPETVEGVECTNCTRLLADRQARLDNTKVGSESDSDGPSPRKRSKLKPVLRAKQKQITVGRLPKNLVIHINRSIFNDYGEQRKNTSLIDYPARLPFLSDWCLSLSEQQDDVQAVYELKCAVTHYGRHENGHYVAFGRRDKDWYCFNDEIVTKLSEEEVLSRGNVFMLFYEAVAWSPNLQEVQEPPKVVETERIQQPSTSSSSGSEVEEQPAQPSTPVRPVPVLRTASGSVRTPDTSPFASTPVVTAV